MNTLRKILSASLLIIGVYGMASSLISPKAPSNLSADTKESAIPLVTDQTYLARTQ